MKKLIYLFIFLYSVFLSAEPPLEPYFMDRDFDINFNHLKKNMFETPKLMCVFVTDRILPPPNIPFNMAKDFEIRWEGDSVGIASFWTTIFCDAADIANEEATYIKKLFISRYRINAIQKTIMSIGNGNEFLNYEIKCSKPIEDMTVLKSEDFGKFLSKLHKTTDIYDQVQEALANEKIFMTTGACYIDSVDFTGNNENVIKEIDPNRLVYFICISGKNYDKSKICYAYIDDPEEIYCLDNKSIAEASLKSTLLYPNPASSTCTISGNLIALVQDFSITISDINGKKLFEVCKHQNLEGEFSFSFDTKSLPSGSYNVILNADGKKQIEKLIIER